MLITARLALVALALVWSSAPLAQSRIQRSERVPINLPDEDDEDDEDDEETTLATVTTTRQVAMFYRLDLKRDNDLAPSVADVMRLHDAKLRSCYSARLDADAKLRGDLAFAFNLSAESGTMRRIKRVGGSIEDKQLERCLRGRLAALPFNPPRDTRGTVVYRFDARTLRVETR